MILGVLPALASPSLYLCAPSIVTLPSSALTRTLTPWEPITRSRSATGLKSIVVVTPAFHASLSLLFFCALARLRIDRVDRAVACDAVEQAIGRTYVDPDDHRISTSDHGL